MKIPGDGRARIPMGTRGNEKERVFVMSEQKETVITEEKKQTLSVLRNSEEIYMLMSACTKMPFVVCDPETYDDKIFLFNDLETAKKCAEKYRNENQPVNVGKVGKKQLLPFYSSLYTMGINCLAFENKEEKITAVQLEELVKRGDINHLPEGKVWVENPGLHLTSLYFMQEMRRHKKPELTEEMKELQEEILSNFQRGTYIAAVQEGNKIPLLKQQDGTSFQPIFTDVIEFQKFNREQKFKSAVIKADKLLNILVPEAKGVVINPFGVNLQLPIKRKK